MGGLGRGKVAVQERLALAVRVHSPVVFLGVLLRLVRLLRLRTPSLRLAVVVAAAAAAF